MPSEQSEREETRPAVRASVHSPVIHHSRDTVDLPGLETEQPASRRGVEETTVEGASYRAGPLTKAALELAERGRRRPLLVLGSVIVVALLLVLVIADVGHPSSAERLAHQHTPTATLAPTPTVIPTPTVRPGFQIFVDTSDGFLLQYPVGWSHRLSNPGAEFSDDAVNTTFEMQVLLPPASAAAGLSGNPNDPTSWVNFAMQSFVNQYASDFQQDAGPLPAANFAGASWQTARGLISDQMSQVSIQIQVYATIYQGNPYIISLYAAADAFSVANRVYFQHMLDSFEFLPVTA
jgi:hypothetical protein